MAVDKKITANGARGFHGPTLQSLNAEEDGRLVPLLVANDPDASLPKESLCYVSKGVTCSGLGVRGINTIVEASQEAGPAIHRRDSPSPAHGKRNQQRRRDLRPKADGLRQTEQRWRRCRYIPYQDLGTPALTRWSATTTSASRRWGLIHSVRQRDLRHPK